MKKITRENVLAIATGQESVLEAGFGVWTNETPRDRRHYVCLYNINTKKNPVWHFKVALYNAAKKAFYAPEDHKIEREYGEKPRKPLKWMEFQYPEEMRSHSATRFEEHPEDLKKYID